jgi:DNA-binding HxlR family transcriptional regulator
MAVGRVIRSNPVDAPDDEAAVALGDGTRPRSHRAWTPLARALTAAGDRWTLMIVHGLAPGRMRLSQLHRSLPGVSTGVLERYLSQMVELGLVTRRRFKELPPRVELELTDTGRELLPIAAAFARWGMRNRWSPPDAHERVDMSALLTMLPALLEGGDLGDGSVEAVVMDDEGAVHALYSVRAGRVDLVDAEDVPDAEPSARIVGDERAWTAALAPSADYSGLLLWGDERFTRALLDALPRG